MIRFQTIIFLAVAALLIFSCEAPRLNPLDPQSNAYNLGQFDGYVFSYPREALANVRVTWKNQNISTQTDSKGYYKFTDISVSDGIVYLEKEGFKKDSINVVWNNQKNIRLDERVLDYTIGIVDGVVRAAAPLLKPLAGVKTFWKNQNILITTDSQGNFSLNNIPYGNGWLYFEYDGYSKDSVYINFSDQREKVKHLGNIYLNSIPKLHEFKIYTSVENRYPDIKRYRMEVQVNISDDEGEIDSVFLKCDELKFSKSINYNLTSRNFEGSYIQSDLNLSSMEEVIGKNFYIVVKDLQKKTFTVGSSNIKRIITDVINLVSPANSEFTTSLPTLKWERYLPGFNFYYSVQIYTNEIFPILMYNKEKISKADIQLIINSNLSAGDYYWVIWCIDDFGNRARSRPATFSVK